MTTDPREQTAGVRVEFDVDGKHGVAYLMPNWEWECDDEVYSIGLNMQARYTGPAMGNAVVTLANTAEELTGGKATILKPPPPEPTGDELTIY